MFIAHLPAGYIAAKLLFNRVRSPDISFKSILFASLMGAVAPDVDLLYFYFIDDRQHNHHSYWTHYPVAWTTLLAASFAWSKLSMRWRPQAVLMGMFCFSGMVHMVLDTAAGGIQWFAPFSSASFTLFSVNDAYRIWWLNFTLHWTFSLELLLVAWAIVLWRRDRRNPMPSLLVKHL